MDDRGSDSQPPLMTRVLARLLRPLVRALIAQGVTAPAFYRIVKQTYVDVADRDFRLDEKPPTDSRISILTGVHRRDVRTFRDDSGAAERAAGGKVTTIASVIGRWLSSAEATGPDGAPKPLPRAAKEGLSFEALVRGVSRDIRPKTVLDELLRQGLAEYDEASDQVRLGGGAVAGPADIDQKIHFFAENVGDHISAAVENMLADDSPFIERAVFYNRLTAASVDELEASARDLGMDALIALNRRAGALQAQDAEADTASQRFRFGVFFYREDLGEDPGGESGDDAWKTASRTKNEKEDDDET